MKRNYTMRQMNGVQFIESEMNTPYSFIKNDDEKERYSLNNINKGLEDFAETGPFPNNIEEHFYVRYVCDETGEDWTALGLLTNGNYFLYCAGCEPSGFEVEGGMVLYVSQYWESIVEALSDFEYRLYYNLTKSVFSPRTENEFLDWYNEEYNHVVWGDTEYEEETCSSCYTEPATMGEVCAECYWEIDYDRKKMYRGNPEWRYNAAVSSSQVLFKTTTENAHAIAVDSVSQMPGGKEWLAAQKYI